MVLIFPSIVGKAKGVTIGAESKSINKIHTLSIRHSFVVSESCYKVLKRN
jgi:hypothetical protein